MADIASGDPVILGSLPQDDRSYVAVYVVASIVPVTFLVVCLRLYTRWAVVESLGIDDWATLAAMVCLIASVSSKIYSFRLTRLGEASYS